MGAPGTTPGPWSLTHVEGSNFAIQRFEIRGVFADAANVYPVFNRSLSAIEGGTICVRPEDAHQLAASPDLYDALEVFVREYVDHVESGDAGFWDAEKEPKVIAARAALAKARGQ